MVIFQVKCNVNLVTLNNIRFICKKVLSKKLDNIKLIFMANSLKFLFLTNRQKHIRKTMRWINFGKVNDKDTIMTPLSSFDDSATNAPLTYESFDFQSKSIDWFLYESNIGH